MNRIFRPLSRRFALLGLCLSAVVSSCALWSAPLAIDRFDYPAGYPLDAFNGGHGWSGAWTGAAGVTIVQPSPELIYDVNGVKLGGGNCLNIAAASPAAAVRDVFSSLNQSGAPYFVSFLFRAEGGTPGNVIPNTLSALILARDGDPNIAVDALCCIGNNYGNIGARVENSSAWVNTKVKYGETYFVVVGFSDWNAASGQYRTTTVWVNPDRGEQYLEPDGNAAKTRSITKTSGGSSGFRGLQVHSVGLGGAGGYFLFDDLRVGTEWRDVVPVLLGYENFDGYGVGQGLNGLDGGLGWSGSWQAVSGGVTVEDASLTYPLGAMTLGGGKCLKIVANSPTTNAPTISRRVFPATGNGATDKDYYLSFIFRVKGSPANGDINTVFTGWQALDGAVDVANDSIGYIGSAGKAGARVGNASTPFSASIKYEQTYFCVIRYGGWNGSAYTRSRIWINPDVGDAGSSDPAVTVSQETSGKGSSDFLGLHLRTNGLGPTEYYLVDDLRIGRAWTDVVPAFKHPAITLGKDDLEIMRSRATGGASPQSVAWQDMLNPAITPGMGLTDPHHAKAIVTCDSDTSDGFLTDANLVWALALKWYVTRDARYAARCIEVMNAWAAQLQGFAVAVEDPPQPKGTPWLNVGWTAQQYAEAAELIRHTYLGPNGQPLWAASDIAAYQNMLKNVFLPQLKRNTLYCYGNWDAAITNARMAIAVFCEDRAGFDDAVSMWRGQGRGSISNYLWRNGQCEETNRDRVHTQMGIAAVAKSAEIAWHQGLDLYSTYVWQTAYPLQDLAYTGNYPHLALGAEYTARFLTGHEISYVIDPATIGPGWETPTTPKKEARTDAPKMGVWEIALNHYQNRLGLDLPETATWVASQRATHVTMHPKGFAAFQTLTHGGDTRVSTGCEEMTEGQMPTGWNTYTDNNGTLTCRVQAGKFLRLYDSSTAGRITTRRVFASGSPSGLVAVGQWRFRVPTLGGVGGVGGQTMQLRSDDGTIGVELVLDNGELKYRGGGGALQSMTPVQPINQGTWYEVKIVARPGTNQADCHVNGKLRKADLPFVNALTDVADAFFATHVANTGALDIDDVVLRK